MTCEFFDEMGTKISGKMFGLLELLKKYFWEGQVHATTTSKAELPEEDSSLVKFEKRMLQHKKAIGVLIPFVLWQFIWWSFALRHGYFALFLKGYKMSITMIFGALVAGMISDGGGALVFPVMTLALQISPETARDFALMIQSFGMTSATFCILWMKVYLEWHVIVYASIGGVAGIIFGLEVVESWLTASARKMAFVSAWFSFAVALFILNRKSCRVAHTKIRNFSYWQMIVLILVGFVGGNFSALGGSGLGICSFACLTLLFSMSEKVASSTAVVLMAGNTVVGFVWRQVMMEGIASNTWEYVAVCVPIVALNCPLGSLLASHMHREVLASIVYILGTISLVAAFLIVKPGAVLSGICVMVMVLGSFGFWGLGLIGDRISRENTEPTHEKTRVDVVPKGASDDVTAL